MHKVYFEVGVTLCGAVHFTVGVSFVVGLVFMVSLRFVLRLGPPNQTRQQN